MTHRASRRGACCAFEPRIRVGIRGGMPLTPDETERIAERLTAIGPWICHAHTADGRVAIELGDPTRLDLTRLIDQLTELREILDAEGLEIIAATTLGVTVGRARARAQH